MIEGYCWPLSVAPGENISFMISAQGACSASFNRHISTSASVDSFHVLDMGFSATVQPVPPEQWSTGCGWAETFSFTIPQNWKSGIYSAKCTDGGGAQSNISFIVKPNPLSRSKVAVLANVNTWLAYNDWSGHNRYSGSTHLSFLQPRLNSAPEGLMHLTRGELWILGYLESQGISPDVYSDTDFHNDGCDADQYKCLVVGTHPEYWSVQMYDNLKTYLESGGNFLYLGGNGIYDRCEYDSDQTAMTFFSGPGGEHLAAGLFRSSAARAERSILGVATERCGVVGSAYRVRLENADHFLFNDTGLGTGPGETLVFGEAGLNTFFGNGKASGLEVDTYDGPGALGIPIACATLDGIAPPSILPQGLVVLAQGEPDGVGRGADMVYYVHQPGGGFVFSVGSINFGGSLVVDIKMQKLLRNVLTKAGISQFIGVFPPPTPGKIPSFIYGLTSDNELLWYRHDGAQKGENVNQPGAWQGASSVDLGWNDCKEIFPGDGNIIYAIKADGNLLWYRHDGFNNGLDKARGGWAPGSGRSVGTGWQDFKHVFSGGKGIIYAIADDGILKWYRHVYSRTGEGFEVSNAWIGPIDINAGWQNFKHVFSGGDGIIYAITPEGILRWYNHTGFETGAGSFEEPQNVGSGWNDFSHVFSAGAAVDGVIIYAVTENTLFRARIDETNANLHRAGELFWWKHKGYKTGVDDWVAAKTVGHGWEDLSHLFAFLPGTIDVPR